MRAREARLCLCRVGAGCQNADVFYLVCIVYYGLTPTYRTPFVTLTLCVPNMVPSTSQVQKRTVEAV